MTAEELSESGDGQGDSLSLGQKLLRRRNELGLSQSEAARELGVARTAYRLWELDASRPAPDRWRMVARWLGVSVTTLLVAEGWMTEDEAKRADVRAGRFERATGRSADTAAEGEPGSFFDQAQAVIDDSVRRGVIDSEEAVRVREMFARIQRDSQND